MRSLAPVRPASVLTLFAATAGSLAAAPAPKAELPPGYELIVAAAAPLVEHPMMGCFDDRGRFFVSDSAGLNLRPKDLEEKLPNRVLLLEDTDGDQVFDKSTVFADKMTFPQGACWLNGSLYVASPPGIWKLTDTNGDGVADQREMIVRGFEYDGNAADVHGPFLHPNGRLYWCHGRKGHKVVQKDGTLVHEGKASGIWSCRPDGSDVQWYALGCMDNPVEVDFTSDGDIFGVVNLYYNQPRGDTLMHWQYGGAYDRPDQLSVISGLPRTLEHMPIVHNYGHVAVAGCALYHSGALEPAWRGNMFVTFFNTQKVVRTRMVPAGATYTATTHEFLKIDDPDVHLTDVVEDGDGSLLVVDTGGWFRIGCPASLVEKPDLRGTIFRVRRTGAPRVEDPYGLKIAWDRLSPAETTKLRDDPRWRVRRQAAARLPWTAPASSAAVLRDTARPRERLRACEVIAQAGKIDASQRAALLALLSETLDPALEHAAMFAGIATRCFTLEDVKGATAPALLRRLLVVVAQTVATPAEQDAALAVALRNVTSPDTALSRAAVAVIARHPRGLELAQAQFAQQLTLTPVPAGTLAAITEIASADPKAPAARTLVATLLKHPAAAARQTAWRLLADLPAGAPDSTWIAPLLQSLEDLAGPAQANAQAGGGDLLLLLDAVAKLTSREFEVPLQRLAADPARPQPIRLKALAAASRAMQPLADGTFELLLQISKDDGSPASRVEAARLLARSRLSPAQFLALAPVLATTGPVELREFLKLARRADAVAGRAWAESLARSPVFGAIEESAIRSAFSSVPPELYEKILMPAVRAATEAKDAKKRKLETLAAAAARGRAADGHQVYATSTCVACHKAGELGRALGPDLSHIGQIRTARDLLESILFPSATIARDFETHLVETADRQTLSGMIRRDTPEALVLVDLAGEEKSIPRSQIVASSQLPASLMPESLEQTLTEQQLLDLVAWLGSLK